MRIENAIRWKWPLDEFSWSQDEKENIVIGNWFGPDPKPNQGQINQALEEYKSTQGYAIENFNVIKFQSDLYEAIPSLSNIDLRLEFGALNTFATNSDFTEMKDYINLLVANSIATESDYIAVESILAKQGVQFD